MLLIFDWDGTLIDSKQKITTAMQLAAEDLGWPVHEDVKIHNIIGLGLPEAIRSLYPAFSVGDLQRMREAYAARFLTLEAEGHPNLFPGVIETLDWLRGRGHSLAIATGKSRKGLDRVFNNLGFADYFHSTRCADETASKPNPLMLNELLAEFDVDPVDAVMVGDTEYDLAMARSINMPRIAVSYGAHHISRLHAYEPALCLDQFDELLAWDRLAGADQ